MSKIHIRKDGIKQYNCEFCKYNTLDSNAMISHKLDIHSYYDI